MVSTQPINVTVPVCSKCKREIVCEACGKSPATRFGIGHITDELTVIPHDLCDRCADIMFVKPEDQTPSDARALEWTALTIGNMGRYFSQRGGV